MTVPRLAKSASQLFASAPARLTPEQPKASGFDIHAFHSLQPCIVWEFLGAPVDDLDSFEVGHWTEQGKGPRTLRLGAMPIRYWNRASAHDKQFRLRSPLDRVQLHQGIGNGARCSRGRPARSRPTASSSSRPRDKGRITTRRRQEQTRSTWRNPRALVGFGHFSQAEGGAAAGVCSKRQPSMMFSLVSCDGTQKFWLPTTIAR